MQIKKTTSLRHYSKKLCGKNPRLSYGAFGREFLFGLIKIAKQNSVFACMVISQLKLSEMQIQWTLLLQEIWVTESWFSIVFCLVVFSPHKEEPVKKKNLVVEQSLRKWVSCELHSHSVHSTWWRLNTSLLHIIFAPERAKQTATLMLSISHISRATP